MKALLIVGGSYGQLIIFKSLPSIKAFTEKCFFFVCVL